jgi:restriction endonuclease Mrr
MAVPDFQTLMLPLLELAGDGKEHTSAEAVESLAQRFQLSADDRGQLLQNGQPRFNNRVGWATTYLKKAGLLQAVGRGRFEVTDRRVVSCVSRVRPPVLARSFAERSLKTGCAFAGRSSGQPGLRARRRRPPSRRPRVEVTHCARYAGATAVVAKSSKRVGVVLRALRPSTGLTRPSLNAFDIST